MINEKRNSNNELVDILSSLYARKTIDENPRLDSHQQNIKFEDLKDDYKKYFFKNYKRLIDDGYTFFFSTFTILSERFNFKNPKDDLKNIAKKYGIDRMDSDSTRYQFIINNGLLAMLDTNNYIVEQVYYATPEGINSIINNLYKKALYNDNKGKLYHSDKFRKIKNDFIKYAIEHEIKIENQEALEKIQVNPDKVRVIATYLNQIVNEQFNSKTGQDYTEQISQDIEENYSEIMNYNFYNFANLPLLKEVIGDTRDLRGAYLKLGQNYIINPEGSKPIVIYGTPDCISKDKPIIKEKLPEVWKAIREAINGRNGHEPIK